jgi:hypothetical protein
MISELDIYLAGNLVIAWHGADALIEAAWVIDRLLELADRLLSNSIASEPQARWALFGPSLAGLQNPSGRCRSWATIMRNFRRYHRCTCSFALAACSRAAAPPTAEENSYIESASDRRCR